MGLIKAAKDAVGSLLADQWREYFYCDSLSDNVLVVKGQKRVNDKRNSNTKASDNLITNGSIIAVNEGQCMIIVDQGGVVEFCAEAGQFVYDSSTESSIFYGDLGENVNRTFQTFCKRTSFGGNTAKDQRVYFFNTKEIKDNPFGTANPIPFRVVDTNIGLDIDISLRINGRYSFKLVDPILFYINVCGNVTEDYTRDKITGMMKSELVTALQPALARLSEKGVRYSAVPAHTEEITQFLNEELTEKWRDLRGLEVVSMTMAPPTASEEDAEMIKNLQKQAVYRNAGMGAAAMIDAQTQAMKTGAEAMKEAAGNTATGPMLAFAGVNMAGMASNANMTNMGGGMINAGQLYQIDAQNQAVMQSRAVCANAPQSEKSAISGWTCKCGYADNKGKFCENCGAPKQAAAGWTCSCGAVNKGKFCSECGNKKPEGALLYRCDKCGWEPQDPAHPPKFCPECGDVFDEKDRK